MDKILLSGRPRSGKSAFIQACLRKRLCPWAALRYSA